MLALIRKEIRIQFATPVFPVASALFLFLCGLVFTAYLTQAAPDQLPEASMRPMLYFMALIFAFIIPFWTMKSFAEERRNQTFELLKTSPISNAEIVWGKFTAVLILVLLLLALTVEFPLLIIANGRPDVWPMILSYAGLFLFAAALAALGLFASSLTQSQMIAAVLSFVGTLALWFLSEVGGRAGERLSTIQHLHSFGQGVLDAKDAFYYLAFTCVFISLTVERLSDGSGRKKRLTALALLLLISTGTFYFLEKKNIRWDLTANREMNLTPQTREVLQKLQQEVTVVAFFRKGGDADDVFIRRRVNDVLSQYGSGSPNVHYQMIDPDAQMEQAGQFGIQNDGTIVFASGGRRKEIYKAQLFDYQNADEASPPKFVGEGAFTNALLAVTVRTETKICFLQGHGERDPASGEPEGYSQAKTFLEKNNNVVSTFSLASDSRIPSDCRTVVVAGAMSPLMAVEESYLRKWAEQGGSLLWMLEPLIPAPPFLKSLSVGTSPGLVFDASRHFVLGAHYPSPMVLKHDITRDLEKTDLIFFSARSLQFTEGREGMAAFLETSSDAWAENNLQNGRAPAFTPGQDVKGPLTLGLAIDQPKIALLGDSDFASNALIQASGNLDLLLSVIRWLTGEKDQVIIKPQTTDFRNVTLTAGRARFIAYFTQLIWPVVVLLTGGWYWYRRRKL